MNSLRGEYAAELQREEKTPRQFTTPCRCCKKRDVQCRWERRNRFARNGECESATPSFAFLTAYLLWGDTDRLGGLTGAVRP